MNPLCDDISGLVLIWVIIPCLTIGLCSTSSNNSAHVLTYKENHIVEKPVCGAFHMFHNTKFNYQISYWQ